MKEAPYRNFVIRAKKVNESMEAEIQHKFKRKHYIPNFHIQRNPKDLKFFYLFSP